MNLKLLAAIIALGSFWGFAECLIGDWLRTFGLPAGALLTAIVAISLMAYSKTLFPTTHGVQFGMGLVAGSLRLTFPFGGCFICSAIAIMGEGLLFELIWTALSKDLRQIQSIPMQSCLGIITGYVIFVGGYTITQILTPVLSTAGFDLSNLVAYTPQILAAGLLPAVIGAITIPATLALRRVSVTLKDTTYYRITATTTVLCWCLVIGYTLILLNHLL